MTRLSKTSSSSLPLSLAVLLAVAGMCSCGTPEPESETQAEATRTEVVYVDEDSSDADLQPATPHPNSDAVTATLPDTVGGDDLIAYDPEGAFTVQVATFSDASEARRQVQRLDALGYPAYAMAHPSGQPIRVRIGYFARRDEADRFGQRYTRDHGGQYWVDLRAAEESGQP